MALRNTLDRYGSLPIGLHWLMLLLIAAVYACIELHDAFPKGSDMRATLKDWHFMLGLSVLALVIVRLLIKLTSSAPRIVPVPPKWQAISARIVHGMLYALMIGMPLVGWVMLSAGGDAIPFFGWELPALTGANERLADLLEEVHETGGKAGYFLIGLHAAAALFHHFLVKDNTLLRMLPTWLAKRD